ncbi:hypothetical protein P7K49_014384 [Saguinus oedipus]|uniref:Uncharacterized protein n=1 Tax=Saguinus oedipus TaxID=9490 RepID=A0ABQ9VIM9_SAGOE|nr:hypothetical protein P7K49_014384 [Saguinus oedipus]
MMPTLLLLNTTLHHTLHERGYCTADLKIHSSVIPMVRNTTYKPQVQRAGVEQHGKMWRRLELRAWVFPQLPTVLCGEDFDSLGSYFSLCSDEEHKPSPESARTTGVATTTDCPPLPRTACHYHGLPTTTTDCLPLPQTARHYHRLLTTTMDCLPLLRTAHHYHGLPATTMDCPPLPWTAHHYHGLLRWGPGEES